MRARTIRTLGFALALLAPAPALADGWETVSDVGRDALVVAAIGVPVANGDWQGGLQAAGSVAAAQVTSLTLKELIDARRPDGSDGDSFPSGHAAVSFAAAATLGKRHGWKYGLPAVAVASLVAVGRVEADRHYVRDVLAGAAIGTAAGWLITSKRSDGVQLFPWAARRGGGVTLAARW